MIHEVPATSYQIFMGPAFWIATTIFLLSYALIVSERKRNGHRRFCQRHRRRHGVEDGTSHIVYEIHALRLAIHDPNCHYQHYFSLVTLLCTEDLT
jgi:hypothetical protein